MYRQQISAIVLLLLFAAAVPAQSDKIDDFIRSEMQKQNIPGLSLAVIKDGKIIKAAGYGLANIKLKVPASPETVYRIASVSKVFIATGIMLLVQEDRLDLDDPIGNYLEPPGLESDYNSATSHPYVRSCPRRSRLQRSQDSE